jgi:hypothetical protein
MTETHRVALGADLALAIWFAGMAGPGVDRRSRRGDRVWPLRAHRGGDHRRGRLAVTFGRGFVVARSGAAGLPGKLYASGAGLAWPALPRRRGGERG